MKHIITTIVILITLASCVQEQPKKSISVSVNMQDVAGIETVGIRGDFPLSWKETTYLSDEDKDGIYEEDFTIYSAKNEIQFKFIYNDSIYELNDSPNRKLALEFKEESIEINATFNNPETQIIKK